MNAGVKVLEGMETSLEFWNPLLAEDSVYGDFLDLVENYLSKVLLMSRGIEQTPSILEGFISKENFVHKDIVLIDNIQKCIHEIGKNFCYFMLRGIDCKVINLDTDIRLRNFIASIKDIDADIFSCYTLITTTLTIQNQVVKMVRDNNMSIAIIFGGAPHSQESMNNIHINDNLLLCVEKFILISGLYSRRRNMTTRYTDVVRSGFYLDLLIMILCLSVSLNGRK
ncbi:MAG TPA: cobalamin-dependent protein [Candidatus Methanomethylophilaceae archaeon]|nr:cobalamin-dependent protein [Candidatus Methanomethylophilaceae archaeon]